MTMNLKDNESAGSEGTNVGSLRHLSADEPLTLSCITRGYLG